MKYSENLIQRTLKALENLPFSTVWKIHKRAQYEGFCEIRFEDIDGNQMSINISECVISAIVFTDETRNGFKWFGDCYMKQNSIDTYMMWLGITVEKMLNFIEMKGE